MDDSGCPTHPEQLMKPINSAYSNRLLHVTDLCIVLVIGDEFEPLMLVLCVILFTSWQNMTCFYISLPLPLTLVHTTLYTCAEALVLGPFMK